MLLVVLLLLARKTSPLNALDPIRAPYNLGCDDSAPCWVYVVKIAEKSKPAKFYVGSTQDWETRRDDHRNKRGAKCLKQYPATAQTCIYKRLHESGLDARAAERRK